MKLVSPFTVLSEAVGDISRMHDFNYKLPEEKKYSNTFWEKECIDHPTMIHCRDYSD